ncbi:MAG: MFS transporter [Chloroflexi bacterium]|nr:MFS transporter [Chloroflexota bacterium]
MSDRALLIAALMVCTFLTAIDQMVVVTAMPTIVSAVGGLDLYTWVFSSYLLASVASMPIYGRLADIYGRKPVFFGGTGLFLLGSLLCGSAQSMEQLVVFRVIQGLGAGAVQPITITILGDVFSLEERARVSGLFSMVWGTASVLGPPLGGLLTEHVSWRFIFLVNLPVGLLAIAMLWLTMHEKVARRSRRIDYWGSILLAGGLVVLQLAMVQDGGGGGVSTAGQPGVLTLAAVALLVLFVLNERGVAEPILPLDLFRNRLISVSSAGSLVTGATLFATASFVPAYTQGVLGLSASLSGVPLMAESIAWTTASALAGRVIVRSGYRMAALIGGTSLFLGAGSLASGWTGNGLVPLTIELGFMGLGFGFCTLSFVLAIQNAVPWERRGVATSSNQLFRTIGGSLGVSAVGAVFAARLEQQLSGIPAGGQLDPNLLLDAASRATIPSGLLGPALAALEGGLQTAFFAIAALAVCSLIAVSLLPGGAARSHEWTPAGAHGEA